MKPRTPRPRPGLGFSYANSLPEGGTEFHWQGHHEEAERGKAGRFFPAGVSHIPTGLGVSGPAKTIATALDQCRPAGGLRSNALAALRPLALPSTKRSAPAALHKDGSNHGGSTGSPLTSSLQSWPKGRSGGKRPSSSRISSGFGRSIGFQPHLSRLKRSQLPSSRSMAL